MLKDKQTYKATKTSLESFCQACLVVENCIHMWAEVPWKKFLVPLQKFCLFNELRILAVLVRSYHSLETNPGNPKGERKGGLMKGHEARMFVWGCQACLFEMLKL